MPILDPETNLALIALGDRFESSLPPAGMSGSMNPVFASLSHEGFAANHWDDAINLSAFVDRGVAITTGWPEDKVELLGDLISFAIRDVNPNDIGDVLQHVDMIQELFSDLNRTVTETITGAPILGWILKVGLVVWDIVKIVRFREPAMTSNEPLGYDRDFDSHIAGEILKRAPGFDWTDMFSPQPGSFSTEPLAYTNAGAVDGFAWGQLRQQSDQGELGLMPGIGAISGYWQSPRKTPGSTRRADLVNIVANNQLLPSATSLSGLLWTANQAPGPMLARIDLHALASLWDEYGAKLESFADDSAGPLAQQLGLPAGTLEKQIRNGWRWLDPHYNSPLFGVKASEVPSEYRGWGLQNLIAWRLGLARVAVRKNMSTINCAYVPPSAPGLSDPPTHKAWKEARWRLLYHKARMYVDASIIPDAEYRGKMKEAQGWGPITDFQVRPPGLAKPKPAGWGAPDELLGKEPDEPWLPLPPGDGSEGPEGADAPSEGAGAVAALVGLVVAGVVARKLVGRR